MIKVIALDPGGTTGFALYENGKVVGGGQWEAEKHHQEMMDFLLTWRPDVVVCERFEYRSGLPNADLRAREYIGVAELFCQMFGAHLEMQVVAVGKDVSSMWTNKILTKMAKVGLIPTQSGLHQKDATRHLLHYVAEKLKNPRFYQVFDI